MLLFFSHFLPTVSCPEPFLAKPRELPELVVWLGQVIIKENLEMLLQKSPEAFRGKVDPIALS